MQGLAGNGPASPFLHPEQEICTMPASINLDDIPPDQRKQMGLKTPRKSKFSQEEVRSWALKVLAAMAGLTRDERDRVLKHAAKVNKL
jgi:hypothetical protein